MSVRFAKLPPGRNPSPFQKILHRLSGIRIRLMLWYIVTTILILLLFGSLLYSTIARTLPSTANKTPANAVLQVAKSYVTDGKLSSSEGPDNVLLINAQGELMEEQPVDSDLPQQLLPEVK